MTTSLEEPIVLVVEDIAYGSLPEELEAKRWNKREVLLVNREASAVDAEALEAFLELLYAADADYISVEPPAPAMPAPLLNWDEVGQVLAESQAMLQSMQQLLSLTLAEMGVEDHAGIRVYEDESAKLRLVVDHPRREEIETVLNSPENRQLQDLYRAAVNGMGLAGSLVGNGAVPTEVLSSAINKANVA